MPTELTQEEKDLLKDILEKELGQVREEVHHSSNLDYKGCLQMRETLIRRLIDRLKA
jgi:hypothetical protein